MDRIEAFNQALQNFRAKFDEILYDGRRTPDERIKEIDALEEGLRKRFAEIRAEAEKELRELDADLQAKPPERPDPTPEEAAVISLAARELLSRFAAADSPAELERLLSAVTTASEAKRKAFLVCFSDLLDLVARRWGGKEGGSEAATAAALTGRLRAAFHEIDVSLRSPAEKRHDERLAQARERAEAARADLRELDRLFRESGVAPTSGADPWRRTALLQKMQASSARSI